MTDGVGEVSITLSDMYQAAYLVYNGLTPEYAWANSMVVFKFRGGDAAKLSEDYLSSGHATVNAVMFARAHKDIKAAVRDIQQQNKG